MPPRADKEIVLFVTNIGRQPVDGDPDFFEKAKEVMKLIIQKKILMRPADAVQVMLAGMRREDSEERYATVLQRYQKPTWDFLRCVLDIERTTESFEDWPNFLLQALECTEQFPPKTHVIVILLFDCEPSSSMLDFLTTEAAVNGLKSRNGNILWIGSKPLKDQPPEKRNKSENSLLDILNKTAGGEYMTVNKALESLQIFKKHQSRYMAWKCDLVIGNIGIPTVTYVQATEELKGPKFQRVHTYVLDDNTTKTVVVKAQRELVNRNREVRPLWATIPGYRYGQKFIPVPESDAKGMNENFNIKSMKVLAFIRLRSLALEDTSGNSSRIVLPNGPQAAKPFYCFARALANKGYAAIVRRVYRGKSNPKMNVLFAHLDEPGEPKCLRLVELTYAEDRRVLPPRSIDSLMRSVTEEQQSAAEDFIDAMMLTDDTNEKLFDPGTVPAPSLQHAWNSVSYRALNPHAPLPPMDPALRKLLATPEWTKAKAEPVVARLKAVFPKWKQFSAQAAEGSKEEHHSAKAATHVEGDIKIQETKIKENTSKSLLRMVESIVDLDELFDADMDM